MMNCEKIRQNLLFYLDDEVTDAERFQIEAHLASCPFCRAELERLRTLRADLSETVPAALAQLRLPDEAARQIKSRLADLRGERPARLRSPFALRVPVLPRLRPAFSGLLILATLVCMLIVMLAYPLGLPVHAQEMLVVVPQALTPDTDTVLRVLVRQSETARPVSDAQVTVSLRRDHDQITLYRGKTDRQGTVEAQLHIPNYEPDALAAELIVETRTDQGQYARLAQPVEIRRAWRIMFTSDKPLYRPGQTVHLRALALEAQTGLPAEGREIVFTVETPQGHVLDRPVRRLSAYGIAWADVDLPANAPNGQYRLVAVLGNTRAERMVTVGQYEMPRFRVEMDTTRPYYAPGEMVHGTVRTLGLDGTPVADMAVTLHARLKGRSDAFATVTGRTDAQGNAVFSLNLPQVLDGEQSTLILQAAALDATGHVEWAGKTVPLSVRPLLVTAIPEGGRLRPGIENRVYLLVTTPDGAPVQADMDIAFPERSFSLTTDAFGLAEFTFTPPPGLRQIELALTARDAAGRQTIQTVALSADKVTAQVLLRPDRAAYEVGETMYLHVFSGQGETAYLDVMRGGQTLSTHILTLQAGQAVLPLDVSAEMVGTLELHAYQILADGNVVQDTRFAVVDASNILDVAIKTDRPARSPGETAQVEIVTTLNGRPVQSALGIAVVDESVFALEARAPGFAKLFFLLESELLAAPERGFTLPALLDPPSVEAVRNAQDIAARAAWAALPTRPLMVARVVGSARRIWPWWLSWLLLGAGVVMMLVIGSRWLSGRSKSTMRSQRMTISTRGMIVAISLSLTMASVWLNGCQPLTVNVEKAVETQQEVTRVVEKEVTRVPQEEVPVEKTVPQTQRTSTPTGPLISPTPRPTPSFTAPPSPTSAETLAPVSTPPPPPLLGQFMPETLFWLPEAITDSQGRFTFDLPLPELDTVWRLTVLASTQKGQVGTSDMLIK